MTKCKGCGKEIKWIKTVSGKNMPVDLNKVTVVTDKGEVINGYIPHWSTCPEANSFKRRNI